MNGHRPKRRKVEDNFHAAPRVATADQLQDLLRFRQGSDGNARTCVNQFKDFLTEVAKNEDIVEHSQQLKVLRQYCNQQASASTEQVDFPDLLSTWALAAQNNDDSVLSAIPAALAQFFRTISGSLEFRDFGLSLIHSLLKRDQVRLLDRGLSSPKSKSHLISPCLRLLTEMVSFDGGTLANKVWGKRDVLLKRLDGLLAQHSSVSSAIERRQPSVRRMALRLILALMKFLDASSKTELLSQGRALHTCLHGLQDDGDDIVVETLSAVDKHIIENLEIAKVAKLRFFNATNLSTLSALYGYEVDDDQDAIGRIREAANSLLIKLCTTRKGVLAAQSGWYPPGTSEDVLAEREEGFIDLGLDSPGYFDDYTKNVPVKNGALASFMQSLRPAQDSMQASLLLDIFRVAPELVADYFTKHTRFSTPPNDDPLWRGQFATFFSVVQLPIPTNLGWTEGVPLRPPPLTIVIENVLPRPFERSTVGRLFNSTDHVMLMSGSRIMTVALEKLHGVLRIFSSYSENNSILWRQASQRLIELFLSRAPLLKDVVTALQRTALENETVRNAVLECFATYYRLLPEATAGSKFDIGPVMMDLISILETRDSSAVNKSAFMQQLAYCVTIADLSPATKWFHKPDNETISPVTRLLKLALANEEIDESKSIISAVLLVLETKGIISSETTAPQALVSSLESTKKFIPEMETFLFLDNCICRTNQRPVKYLDHIESAQQIVSDKKPLSLLAACVPEQWEFTLKKHAENKDVLKNIVSWITRYYAALDAAGENFRVMDQFQEQMINVSSKKAKSYFEKALEKTRKKPVVISESVMRSNQQLQDGDTVPPIETTSKPADKAVDLDSLFKAPISPPTSLEGLDRWGANTNVELEIHSGRLGKLIRCVSSPEEEVRRQTFQLLQNIAHIIDPAASSSSEGASRSIVPDERGQTYLLLGELCETIRQQGMDAALPSLVPELAVRILDIQLDPSHQLFIKANRFLLRGPSWDIRRLISHWVDKILLHEPETGDTEAVWTEEVDWLLQLFVHGLVSPADGELYRRSNIWERVLALYAKPGLHRSSKKLVLNMLWRGCIVAGGADTLWTRFGAHSWLDMMGKLEKDEECRKILLAVRGVLEERCDKEGIEKWKENRPILRVVSQT